MHVSLFFEKLTEGQELSLTSSIVALWLHLKVIMSREALNMALVAEQTERYEDMVKWVR